MHGTKSQFEVRKIPTEYGTKTRFIKQIKDQGMSLNCSPTNRERELGLDRRETG